MNKKNIIEQHPNHCNMIPISKKISKYSLSISKTGLSIRSVLRALFVTLSLFFLSFSTLAQDLILTPVITDLPNNQKKVDFVIEEGFDNILVLQFSINWDPASYAFLEVDLSNSALPDLSMGDFGSNPNNTDNGMLSIAWFDGLLSGVTLNDSEILFSLIFEQITLFDMMLGITNVPTAIEVLDNNDNPVNLIFNNPVITGETLSGSIFFDDNGNCLFTSNEIKLANWTIKADGNGQTRYATTNEAGLFNITLEAGDYDISILTGSLDYWTTCQPTYPVTITMGMTPAQLNLPLQADVVCPALTVDISTPFLRRCFDNTYYIEYCNRGTDLAENASVDIAFDPFLSVVESTIPWTFINGNTYTFPIGNIAVGECGIFNVKVNLSCDATLGETHCTEASISPDDLCDPSPLWSGASVKVTGTCIGNEVEFIIQNVGTQNMLAPLEFIVTEDEVMDFAQPPSFQLDVFATEVITRTANGSTWRLESDQVLEHPGGSHPIATVEGCGTNGGGTFSLGFITPFAQDDADLFRDIDCQENIGSFDPNDKQAFPVGFSTEHYIDANVDIEYQIRFQNTGTDTAFNIVILDTLPPELDISTVQTSVSSHSYKIEVVEDGILQFYFPNISLPDSTTNLEGSQGFVKYRISQIPDLPLGTVIENHAAIYFDLNEPEITNVTFHTIGKDFFIMNHTIQISEPGVEMQVFPNPASNYATINVKNTLIQSGNFLLFNQNGSLVQQTNFDDNQFNVQINSLPKGMYFFKILNNNTLLGTGKLVHWE